MRTGRSGSIPSMKGKRESSGERENSRTAGNSGWRERNEEQTDYREYRFSPWEWIQALALAVGAAGLTAYVFYRSAAAFLILLLPAAFLPRYLRLRRKERRQMQLERQFKEAINMLSAALSAGISVENAIVSCRKELEMMYGPEGMMTREFAYMARQLQMNRPAEELMNEFAGRTGLEDVENFARIFQIAKRSGGQLVPIIRRTAQVMDDRFQVKEELRTLTASRQYEQKIMNAMPFLMILYVDATSPGFFSVMYTTLTGRLVMTGCLAVYLLSCWLAAKILDIRVM